MKKLHGFATSLCVLLPLVIAACGGTAVEGGAAGHGAGGNGAGGDGSGGAGLCAHDPPGKTFVFHVHNQGTTTYRLTYGCGGTLPITVKTAAGEIGIGPGSGNDCEFTCDNVYKGQGTTSCSDCGPGYGADLGPGMTADIKWDHRVYVSFMVPEACSGNTSGNDCALGEAVAPSTTQQGALTVCAGNSTVGGSGYCATSDESNRNFTVDTTQDEATIEVM